MHKKFDNKAIEKKWQDTWKQSGIYTVGERDTTKEKEYILVEWPYPSGNLHIGHWHAFAVPDIYVRFRRMQGKQVLYPMGFDAFGLPAENAAIKNSVNPKEWTEKNIAYMKTQLESMGASFSWDKTTSSTDESYYAWTQWMFTEFFKNDIAYRGKGIVNWCPGCNTVIANEQVLANGTCERSGNVIEKREMPQWMLRISKYADRLVDDLDTLDWPEQIKEAQRQWIGRSQGAHIPFALSCGDSVTVFTTRPDTLYGATYLVLAPEHELIETHSASINNIEEVKAYQVATARKNEQDRLDNTKEKTGVLLQGVTAVNPASGETIPVFIADYVLKGYGTGAIMAVPAHDERDFAFAKKFGVEVRSVVTNAYNKLSDITCERVGVYALITNEKGEYLLQYFKVPNFYWLAGGGIEAGESELDCLKREIAEEAGFTDIGTPVKLTELFYDYKNKLDGSHSRNRTIIYSVTVNGNTQGPVSRTEGEIAEELELQWVAPKDVHTVLKNGAQSRAQLLLHAIALKETGIYTGGGILWNSGEFDGMDSEEAKEKITAKVGGKMTNTYRIRDWSVGRQRYWGVPVPIVYDKEGKAHPVPKEHLPWLLPTDVDFRPTGVPPLSKSEELKKRTEEIFGEGWTPEVETLDTFVDSSWYFLRYLDNQNTNSLSSKEAQNNWMPIDMYFGGAEHTTMHLLYSRFWQKALFDLQLVQDSEPYKRRINRGLILGPDGNKMSKSKGNVIDPDDHVQTVGADSVKMYLAFMGPYAETSNYPWDMGGIAGIRRFLERVYGLVDHIKEEEPTTVTKQLHKTIAKVSADVPQFKFNTAISAMMVFINMAEKEGLSKDSCELFLKTLAPFAPFLTEELWANLGYTASIHTEEFPKADEELTYDTEIKIAVQINGKMRGSVSITREDTEEMILEQVYRDQQFGKYLIGERKKVIFVPSKIINIITDV